MTIKFVPPTKEELEARGVGVKKQKPKESTPIEELKPTLAPKETKE